jgi:5-methylcytosine-specific restriction protein A
MTFGDFRVGELYNRKRDLHERFGGQRQGGISTPVGHPVIFLITGESGSQHGYSDGWATDGAFHYYGEGQTGDMQWKGGNTAIRDHAKSGKDLLLFQHTAKSHPLRFLGQFNCSGWHYAEAPDRSDAKRQAIVFELLPEGTPEPSIDPSPSGDFAVVPLAELRAKALASVTLPSGAMANERTKLYYQRSNIIRAYVLRRAEGHCEKCGSPAPFKTKDALPYLEPHHIRRLSDGGPDDPRFMAALCPNCHRRIHYGVDGQSLNADLQIAITQKEA